MALCNIFVKHFYMIRHGTWNTHSLYIKCTCTTHITLTLTLTHITLTLTHITLTLTTWRYKAFLLHGSPFIGSTAWSIKPLQAVHPAVMLPSTITAVRSTPRVTHESFVLMTRISHVAL